MSKTDVYEAYVDGSWQQGGVGYGAVLLKNGQKVQEFLGPVPEAYAGEARQVAGELVAVGKVVQYAQQHGLQEIRLYYDYLGIEKWATGEWKTKQPLTQRYAQFVRGCGVKLTFCKVKAHSGDAWNDRADALAKAGAQRAALQRSSPPDAELADLGRRLAQQLLRLGIPAQFDQVVNLQAARLLVGTPPDAGWLDVYSSAKNPWKPRLHGFGNDDLRARVAMLLPRLRERVMGQGG